MAVCYGVFLQVVSETHRHQPCFSAPPATGHSAAHFPFLVHASGACAAGSIFRFTRCITRPSNTPNTHRGHV